MQVLFHARCWVITLKELFTEVAYIKSITFRMSRTGYLAQTICSNSRLNMKVELLYSFESIKMGSTLDI